MTDHILKFSAHPFVKPSAYDRTNQLLSLEIPINSLVMDMADQVRYVQVIASEDIFISDPEKNVSDGTTRSGINTLIPYVAKKAGRISPASKIYLITANIGDLIFPAGAVSSEYVHAYSAEEPCFLLN